GDEAAYLHEFWEFGAIGAALGAMVIVAPWPQAVERGDRVPDEIAIAQTTSRLAAHRHAKLVPSLLPDPVEPVGARVPRPRTTLRENLDLDLTGVAVRRAAHLALARQCEQAGFRLCKRLGCECAELP